MNKRLLSAVIASTLLGFSSAYAIEVEGAEIERHHTEVEIEIEHQERAERPEKAEKAEKAERPEKAEKPEKAERPEKAEKPEKVEKVG